MKGRPKLSPAKGRQQAAARPSGAVGLQKDRKDSSVARHHEAKPTGFAPTNRDLRPAEAEVHRRLRFCLVQATSRDNFS
jgi:hypothetical protein